MEISKKETIHKKLVAEMAQCIRCGWRWQPRKENPSACPNCKSYEWKVKKIK